MKDENFEKLYDLATSCDGLNPSKADVQRLTFQVREHFQNNPYSGICVHPYLKESSGHMLIDTIVCYYVDEHNCPDENYPLFVPSAINSDPRSQYYTIVDHEEGEELIGWKLEYVRQRGRLVDYICEALNRLRAEMEKGDSK